MLEDGTTFRGTGFGAAGETFGEAVFNTGMTGYQETLTDPSYCGQIVAMTAPHIGNTGINDEDNESRAIWVSGFVIRDPCPVASNWRSARTLDAELAASGITAIAITGTRALTLHLRERGAMRAAISTAATGQDELLERVQASPSMVGADLASVVSTPEPYIVRAARRDAGQIPGRGRRPRHQDGDPGGDGEPGLRGARAARPRAPPNRSWRSTPTACSSPTGQATRPPAVTRWNRYAAS